MRCSHVASQKLIDTFAHCRRRGGRSQPIERAYRWRLERQQRQPLHRRRVAVGSCLHREIAAIAAAHLRRRQPSRPEAARTVPVPSYPASAEIDGAIFPGCWERRTPLNHHSHWQPSAPAPLSLPPLPPRLRPIPMPSPSLTPANRCDEASSGSALPVLECVDWHPIP